MSGRPVNRSGAGRAGATGEASLTGRTLAGFTWAGISAAVRVVLSLSILAVLSRLLKPEDFGLLAIALVFVTMARGLGHRGIASALIQRHDLTDRHIAAGLTLSAAAGAGFAAALRGAAPAVGSLFGEPAVGPVLAALSLVLVIGGLDTVPEALWRRHLRFRALAGAEVLSQLLGYGLVAITMAALGFGVWALVWGTVARHAVFAAAVVTAGPRLPRPGLARRETGELLHAGTGFSSIALCNLVARQGSRLIVGRWLGAESLGHFTRATALGSVGGYPGAMVAGVLFPAAARRQKRIDRLGAVYLHGVELLSLLGLPVGLMLAVCAPEVVAVVLGPQWDAAVPVLQILGAGSALRIAGILNLPFMRAMGALRRVAWRLAVHAGLLLLGVAVGSRWGLEGVAAAAVAASVLSWLMMTQLALSLFGLGWRSLLGRLLPALWAGAWAAPALWLTATLVRDAELHAAVALVAESLACGGATALAVWHAPRFARPRFPVGRLVHLLAGTLAASGPERPMAGRARFTGGIRSLIWYRAMGALAHRLARAARPEHRAVASALAAAIGAGDDRAALALVSMAELRPDLRAEKILSHKHRYLWICVPKVASRSIIATLRAVDPGAELIRDRTLGEILAARPEAREYFRFAFLRHPVDRIRSFYADKHTVASRDRDVRRWFVEPWYGVSAGMGFAAFCRWLETPFGSDAFADRHWLSQHRQVRDADGRLPDFLGCYERLDADWRAVCERLGVPFRPLPRLNARPEDSRETPLDADTVALLRRRYAEDFRLGGYAGDCPGGPA